ncbi:hypothetical protein SD37_30190 [Amycolatopsis orientalis]|uniref:Outer membrane channel protein CpnT-like N-terminal domain-containing protein n=1 Tax=Amycolatopsis orientalis TaxID=31958 RepID=A0A193C516_AMYOR|nr:hypothetical protein [Amycolatopsis orientalis]ANN19468.1 hypothetical protein SD37_30190 [Amycolatopsis orientalis]
MSDIVEPEGNLWNWVVSNGGQPREAIWPSDSETAAWDLGTAWTDSAKALNDAVLLSDNAAGELRKAWRDAAGFELYYAIHSLNNGSPGESGVKEMVNAMNSLSGACRSYGDLIVSAKHDIRKHISDNNELFGRCTSWAAQTVFAIKVAQQIATLMNDYATKVGKPAGEETKAPKKPKSKGFWGKIGGFFVGIGEGAVDMFVGFAALAGYGDGHFSWDTFGTAWKGLGKFGLAVATYSTPGLAQLDQTVGIPGFERGAMGDTLKGAGKELVAWDTWSEDPSRAAGKATFNIVSSVLGTKGAGAGLRGAGAAAAGSKVSAVAAVGRVAEKAGTAITKIPTGTELAAKAVRKVPGVDSLLSKVGLGHSPAGVPAHTGDTPPPPHNPRTPDDTPPTNPPGDRTPDGPTPERPPNRPPGDRTPEHVPDERRPARTPEERVPDRTPEPSTRPDPATRPEPTTRPEPATRPEPSARPEPAARPGSVGEAMEQGTPHASGKDTPPTGTEQGSPAPKANEEAPPASHREQESSPASRAENPSEAARPDASEAPVHHERTNTSNREVEAAGHRARDVDEPRATINPETGEVRMSDRVDPADTRESTVLPEAETVRKAQQEWATAAPVVPRTRTQKVIYTTARILGLVHVGEDMARGHHITPSSEPPTPHPTREPAPKDPTSKDKEKTPEKSTPASLPEGDPGRAPRHDTEFVDVDLDAGKPRQVEPPEPAPKGEPALAGQAPPAAAAARAEGAVPETPRPPTRSHRSDWSTGELWPELGPRSPGSRMPMGDPFPDRHYRRPEHPTRGGDHPQHPSPTRAPDGDVPPARDIHSVINPDERVPPGGSHHDGGDAGDSPPPREETGVPDQDPLGPHRAPDPDLDPQIQTRWHEPHFEQVLRRNLGENDSFFASAGDLHPHTRYDIYGPDGTVRSHAYTDHRSVVTHVDAVAPNNRHHINAEVAWPARNADYRVQVGHRVDSFATKADGTTHTVTSAEAVDTIHGKHHVTRNAEVETPRRPAKTVRVPNEHMPAPKVDEPFSHRSGLDRNTRYHVVDEEGRPRGTFQTDGEGKVKWIDTDQHPGRVNPELANRVGDANYRVDRGPMHQEYRVDGEGIPEPGVKYERPETIGPPVHHEREVGQSEAFNRKHTDAAGNPKLDADGNPTLEPDKAHTVTDEYGQPRATHYTDADGKITHVEAETGQRGRTNAEIKHGDRIGADVTQDGFYGTKRAKNPEHTWPKPDNEVTYSAKGKKFTGGKTEDWAPHQREQVTKAFSGKHGEPFTNRPDLPPNTRFTLVDHNGLPYGTFQTGPTGAVTHVHTGKPFDADLNHPPKSAVVSVDDGTAFHRTDARGNTVATSGVPDPDGASTLRRDGSAQSRVGASGGIEVKPDGKSGNIDDGGHHRGTARGGGGEAINQGTEGRRQNQGNKNTPLTPKKDTFFALERRQDKAGDVVWEDIFELRDRGVDDAHSRHVRWREVDENGRTTIHVRSFPNDHNVELWPRDFRS